MSHKNPKEDMGPFKYNLQKKKILAKIYIFFFI